MTALSLQDTAFLRRETPSTPMHWVTAIELDPVDGPPLDLDTLRRTIRRRLPHLPELRWRVLEAPLGLGRPHWVEHDGFRIEDHVAEGPALADRAALDDHMAVLLTTPLERSRPLWEVQLLPPFADGSQFLLCRFHHSLSDGVHTRHVFTQLFVGDDEGAGSPSASRAVRPTAGERLAEAAEIVRLRALPSMRRRVRRALRRPGPVAPPLPPGSLAGRVGGRRTVALRTVDSRDIRRARRALGGVSTNGLYLALVAGGLDRLLDARGTPAPERPLRALVPRNARRPGEEDVPGTSTWSMFVDLPVGVDPVERAHAIQTAIDTGLAAERSFGDGGFAWDVTVTMVLARPVHPGGRRASRCWVTLPLQGRNRLAVGSIVTPESFTLTFTADGDAFPDLDVLADGAVESLADLCSPRGVPS